MVKVYLACSLFTSLLCFADPIYSQYLPNNHYKARNIFSVMETIGNTTGNIKGLPTLKVSKNRNLIAEYTPLSNEIIVGEGFYDFCKGFAGDSLNALACVIGHELGHYYNDHDYSGGFNELLGNKSNPKVSIETKKYLEANADAFGLKYAYLGGYPSYSVYPDLLDKIYKHFRIQNNPGYPSKSERIAIAAGQVKKVKPLIQVFETALFLHVNGCMQEALTLYEYLLIHDFISAEILNNMGAIYLSKAIKLNNPENISDVFFFPCEIDPSERLRSILQRGVISESKNQLQFLQDAEKYLQNAIERNPKLSTANINLASTFILKGEYVAAIQHLKNMELTSKASGENPPSNYYLLMGIVLALKGEFNEASGYIQLAKKFGAYHIDANMKAFNYYRASDTKNNSSFADSKIKFVNEYYSKKVTAKFNQSMPEFETMQGDFSFRSLRNLQFENEITNGSKQSPFYLNYDETTTGVVKRKIQFVDKTFFMIQINNKYLHPNPLGIFPGQNINKLESQYGRSFWQLRNSIQNKFLIYRGNSNSGLLVETKNDTIKTLSFYYLE